MYLYLLFIIAIHKQNINDCKAKITINLNLLTNINIETICQPFVAKSMFKIL